MKTGNQEEAAVTQAGHMAAQTPRGGLGGGRKWLDSRTDRNCEWIGCGCEIKQVIKDDPKALF